MDAHHFSHFTSALQPASRRAAITLAASAFTALLSPVNREAAANRRRKKKRRKERKPDNVCAGRNWCVDRTQTCGPEDGYGKCLIEATGENICAEILFQVPSCAECEAPNCVDCVCVLAAGGGDRCNNGANGYDYICARAV